MKINKIPYLYHGTNQYFEQFDFNKAKPFKDFGKGFYLTTNPKQAQRWAQQKARSSERTYIYRYKLSPVADQDLKILELLQYDETWVKFISASRINGAETDYDLIYDRMADNQTNNISEALRKYVEHEISATEVIQKLKWNDSHEADQYCFKTEKALQLLKDRVVIVLKKDKSGTWKVEDDDASEQ